MVIQKHALHHTDACKDFDGMLPGCCGMQPCEALCRCGVTPLPSGMDTIVADPSIEEELRLNRDGNGEGQEAEESRVLGPEQP